MKKNQFFLLIFGVGIFIILSVILIQKQTPIEDKFLFKFRKYPFVNKVTTSKVLTCESILTADISSTYSETASVNNNSVRGTLGDKIAEEVTLNGKKIKTNTVTLTKVENELMVQPLVNGMNNLTQHIYKIDNENETTLLATKKEIGTLINTDKAEVTYTRLYTLLLNKNTGALIIQSLYHDPSTTDNTDSDTDFLNCK